MTKRESRHKLNNIFEKHLQTVGQYKVSFTEFSPKCRYAVQHLVDGTYSFRLPKVTNSLTLAICLHEIGHAVHRHLDTIDPYVRFNPKSFDEEIIRMSPKVDMEDEAWEFAFNILRKENVKITDELIKERIDAIDTYVARICRDVAETIYIFRYERYK